MAKGIQLACGGHQIAQIGAVGGLDAFAGRNDHIGLAALQLVHLGKELVLIEGHLRQQDQIRAFAVVAARKAGRTGKPARMSTHDLGHGHAADVIHGGIPDDFL